MLTGTYHQTGSRKAEDEIKKQVPILELAMLVSKCSCENLIGCARRLCNDRQILNHHEH